MSISKLVLHLQGENRRDQSLPTETCFWYVSKIYWFPTASRYKRLSPAQTDVSHNPTTETFPPRAWVTANYPPFPTHNVFPRWLRAPCPLSLAQLNSLTFKPGANVCSPVKPYSTSRSKSTHILLYVFLPWSVCAPITQLDWEPWETRDHTHLSSCLLGLYPRKAGGNMREWCKQTKQQWGLGWGSSVLRAANFLSKGQVESIFWLCRPYSLYDCITTQPRHCGMKAARDSAYVNVCDCVPKTLHLQKHAAGGIWALGVDCQPLINTIGTILGTLTAFLTLMAKLVPLSKWA